MADESEPAPLEIFCNASRIDEPATTSQSRMNLLAWMRPTGFPPSLPVKAFIPEPGALKPVHRGVALAGTLESDAEDSLIDLVNVTLAPHSPIALRYLAGQRLSLGYGSPLALGHLRHGDRISVSAELVEFPHPHLQQSDWRLTATCSGVFWLSRPPP